MPSLTVQESPDYEQQRRDADKHLPEIKRIVGSLLLSVADEEEDQERNTDLIVLRASDKRIGCRVRQHKYLVDYPYDFTIRAFSGGHKTEFHKVLEGWGDWMFYGFESPDRESLCAWRVLDLDVFRERFPYVAGEHGLPSIPNPDGKTRLFAFDVRNFPESLIVAKHRDQ